MQIFKKENFFTPLILFFYFSACYLLFLSYFGLFNYFFITVYLILLLLFYYFLLKNAKFESFEWILILLVPFILGGFILFKGFISGDAYVIWFPWAQQIADSSWMPRILENSAYTFAAADFPLFMLFLAVIFKFFPHQENLTFVVPLIFNILTFLLIYHWFKRKGINKIYVIFGLLLLICNPLLAKYGWDLLQESLILFFYTAFFYFLDIYQQNKTKKDLILLIIVATLAMLSKVSGFFLTIPLIIIFFKDSWFKKKNSYWLLLFFAPLASWLARNYIFYGNPIFPIGENLFSGPYRQIVEFYIKYLSQRYGGQFDIIVWFKNLFTFFPVLLIAFYGLIRKKRWLVFLPIIVMLILEASLSTAVHGTMRHNYAILGVLVFYGILTIWQERSKIANSLFFLVSCYTLISIPLIYSQSKFFAPIEQKLYFFSNLIELIINYRWLVLGILTIWFYHFFVRKNLEISKYILLTVLCLNFLNYSSIQISWLNIWSFILLFIFALIIAPFLLQIKIFLSTELFIRNLLIFILLVMLVVNSLGLASTYFIAHKKFVFPKPEALESMDAVGNFLRERERDNKDFYILGDFPAILGWKFGYHETSIDNYTFHYLTKGQYQPEMIAEELHDFLRKYNFKYINKTADYSVLRSFYQKIGENSDFFPLIFEEKNTYVWLVK